jgi:hypothetical protein
LKIKFKFEEIRALLKQVHKMKVFLKMIHKLAQKNKVQVTVKVIQIQIKLQKIIIKIIK